MVLNEKFDFDEVVARLSVAYGGGPATETEVVVVRNNVTQSFDVAYCRSGENCGYFQRGFSFRSRMSEHTIAHEYIRALHSAVIRAELR